MHVLLCFHWHFCSMYPQEMKRPMLASGPKGDDRQEEEKCAALVTLAKPILVSPIPRHFAKPSQGKGATWRTSKVIWQ